MLGLRADEVRWYEYIAMMLKRALDFEVVKKKRWLPKTTLRRRIEEQT